MPNFLPWHMLRPGALPTAMLAEKLAIPAHLLFTIAMLQHAAGLLLTQHVCVSAAPAGLLAEHLEMIESQALEMMMHNDRLEKRMAALEQHTQVRQQHAQWSLDAREKAQLGRVAGRTGLAAEPAWPCNQQQVLHLMVAAITCDYCPDFGGHSCIRAN